MFVWSDHNEADCISELSKPDGAGTCQSRDAGADEETKENSEETATNEIRFAGSRGNRRCRDSGTTGQAAVDALPLEDGETAGAAADVWFSEESILEWPVSERF